LRLKKQLVKQLFLRSTRSAQNECQVALPAQPSAREPGVVKALSGMRKAAWVGPLGLKTIDGEYFYFNLLIQFGAVYLRFFLLF